ncbi:MAG: T9SS type A sorting domain-containing protein [Bacteroidia bacterium]|nr:T9SS type A sorting domain-containing protein [Bacteroidia bacterium]
MKNTIFQIFISISCLVFFLQQVDTRLYAQCTPDSGCVDIVNSENGPGQICPDPLPSGTVGMPYIQTVTIIPPYEGEYEGNTVTVDKITLDAVENLPPGLSYVQSATEMFPYHSYCVLVSGTPTTAGVYNLSVKVTPYVTLGPYHNVECPQQIDDSSLVITIHESSSVYDINGESFEVMNIAPNPYRDKITISYCTLVSERIELKIFDILGKEIYYEKNFAMKGRNYSEFDGRNLKSGIYICSVSNGKETYIKRIIKI